MEFPNTSMVFTGSGCRAIKDCVSTRFFTASLFNHGQAVSPAYIDWLGVPKLVAFDDLFEIFDPFQCQISPFCEHENKWSGCCWWKWISDTLCSWALSNVIGWTWLLRSQNASIPSSEPEHKICCWVGCFATHPMLTWSFYRMHVLVGVFVFDLTSQILSWPRIFAAAISSFFINSTEFREQLSALS